MDRSKEMTDDEIRAELKAIDESDNVDTSDYETGFIESLVYINKRPLTEKQRAKALEIIDQYLGKY